MLCQLHEVFCNIGVIHIIHDQNLSIGGVPALGIHLSAPASSVHRDGPKGRGILALAQLAALAQLVQAAALAVPVGVAGRVNHREQAIVRLEIASRYQHHIAGLNLPTVLINHKNKPPMYSLFSAVAPATILLVSTKWFRLLPCSHHQAGSVFDFMHIGDFVDVQAVTCFVNQSLNSYVASIYRVSGVDLVRIPEPVSRVENRNFITFHCLALLLNAQQAHAAIRTAIFNVTGLLTGRGDRHGFNLTGGFVAAILHLRVASPKGCNVLFHGCHFLFLQSVDFLLP
nr:MAG TPA: hypothetical protein [Caudoviricetes sp.]